MFRLRPLGSAVLLLNLSVLTALASEDGQRAAAEVSQACYDDYLKTYLHTHMGESRCSSTDQHNAARDNIKVLFESFGGLTVEIDSCGNVVATKRGTLYPDEEYIIGAHYDSACQGPGADDNASGVALVLEAARILSLYPSDYTIHFIAFDAEELVLLGSKCYVDHHPGALIRGMIAADMVAYDISPNRCRVGSVSSLSDPLKNTLAAAILAYGDGLTPEIDISTATDHYYFEVTGRYQACHFREYSPNPQIHRPQDAYELPGYLNLPYAVKMTRSVVGFLVDAAGVHVPLEVLRFVHPAGLPEYSDPRGRTIVQVDVVDDGLVHEPNTGELHYNTGSGWNTVPMTLVGIDRYEVVMPAASCGTEIRYYFSARATNGQTFQDPRTVPVYATKASYGSVHLYETDLDVNPQWAVDAKWEYGPPLGGGTAGGRDPSVAHTGVNVYGYNLAGDYEPNLPEKNLTLPALNCLGYRNVRLSFWRWLNVDVPRYDLAAVRVSSAETAGSFQTIWSNPSRMSDFLWVDTNVDLALFADNRAGVTIRWAMGPTNSGVQYGGWNIDDVRVTALDCHPPPLPGDLNCDEGVDFKDINPFVLALSDPAGYQRAFPECNLTNADTSADGVIDFRDINPFVALLSGGGAP